MSSAITRCPDCGTSFRVTESQLLAADGSVRCGACLNVFQAEAYFLSPLLDRTELLAIEADYWTDFELWLEMMQSEPEPEPNPEEADTESGVEPLLDVVFSPAEASLVNGVASKDFPGVNNTTDAIAEPDDSENLPSATVDSFVYEHDDVPDPANISIDVEHDPHHLVADHRRSFSLRWLRWLPGVLVAVAALGIQYAWFQRDVFAQDVRYRHYYESTCRYLQCNLPTYRNPDKLSTRELVIRTHPDVEQALVVDVLLRNDAEYRQAFPSLRLTFYDVRGAVVARRDFEVNEYLGGELRGLKLIPARTEVRLSLELVDPGPDALGYEIEVLSAPL